MTRNWTVRRKTGLTLLAAGLALTLLCHFAGSWELFRYDGDWRSLRSDKLDYDISYFEAHSRKTEVGRVVICEGFGASTQIYFPLALSLLRSGYSVRLLGYSGMPNSKVEMSYKSHPIESLEAARDFVSDRPDLPLFLIGHSEGTRYALQTGRDIPSTRGVVVMSPVSASLDEERPANVLALIADDDFSIIKRQANFLLTSGTGLRRPEFGKLYGSAGDGTARMAGIVAETNHFNIFLDKESQRKTIDWLNKISGNPDTRIFPSEPLKFPLLAIAAILSAAAAASGVGLLFPQGAPAGAERKPAAWGLLAASVGGWTLAALIGDSIGLAQRIPLLVYGRVLVFIGIASLPLAALALIKPSLGAGPPRGSWKARAALFGVSATLLLFDRWLIGVIPLGRRLLWFSLAALISGIYFGFDEFLRRGIQRATDWKTGFASGLIGSFAAALSVAVAGFFLPSPVGQFLVGGAVTLFVLMAACEIPATYLFSTTGDWLLSWWVRVSVFNGFIAALVPLASETAFRDIILR